MSVDVVPVGLAPVALPDGPLPDERIVVAVDASRRDDPDVGALLCAGAATSFVDASSLPPTGFSLRDPSPGDLALLRAAAGEPPEPREPVAAAALRARELAPRHCRPVGPGVPDCSGYHGRLPSLRLLGVLAGPSRYGSFFHDGIAAAVGKEPARVLVAGAADMSMLAHVIHALGPRAADAELTVLDRCGTPVALSAWYAARRGLEVRSVVADAATWADAGGLDVIATNSLLTLLSPEHRRATVRRWRAMLRPGGRIVTDLRIALPAQAGVRGYSDPDAWAALVRDAAEARRDLLPFDPAAAEADARGFAAGIQVHPVTGEDEVRDLFTGAGLRIERLTVDEHVGRVPDDRAGPGADRSATYARIVAVA